MTEVENAPTRNPTSDLGLPSCYMTVTIWMWDETDYMDVVDEMKCSCQNSEFLFPASIMNIVSVSLVCEHNVFLVRWVAVARSNWLPLQLPTCYVKLQTDQSSHCCWTVFPSPKLSSVRHLSGGS